MPRKYERKTTRGAEEDELRKGRDLVKEGSSIRAAAKDLNISRMTLKRYIQKCETAESNQDDEVTTFGYSNCKTKNMIFRPECEADLASHIVVLAEQFHGLTRNKCRELIVEYATYNNIAIPVSWRRNGMTGNHFWISFKERNNLSIRAPEATSLARASAFNRHTVSRFFQNLASVMDQYKFECHEIYNMDETGCTTVQQPEKVATAVGVKQVGSVTSGERGQLVTVVYAVSASRSVVPPLFIFPRKNTKITFVKSGPTGCIGGANASGWINEDLFITYLKHFISYTRCSLEKKVLLILDNHETHASLSAIDLARQSGVVLLTLPPHTSHKLQPLDVNCYKPFKSAYGRAIDNWMRSNPGKTITIYDIPEFVSHAQMHGLTAQNIVSGFQRTGIFPFNQDVFSEAEFAPAAITDRDLPSSEISPTEHQATASQMSASETLSAHSDATLMDLLQDIPSTSRETVPFDRTYVSPKDIVPLPKAGPRKRNRRGKKKGDTKILTNTPVRNSIADALATKKNIKNGPKAKARKTLFQGRKRKDTTSSEETDVSVVFAENSDSDSSEQEEILEGDFVVVKVMSVKSRFVHYIALVDALNDDEKKYEGVFFRRE